MTHDHGYYAGFLDGEGCFSVNGGTPRVYVSNTHLPSLDNLKTMYGGRVSLRDKATETTRECYEWVVYGPTAIAVCKALLTDLREKQAQAALLINWYYETRTPAREGLNRMIKELKRL